MWRQNFLYIYGNSKKADRVPVSRSGSWKISGAEKKLLVQQYELAQSGFENLRRHQEEVMMLRRDMKKHLLFLRQSTSDIATANYLEELIG